VAGGSETAKFYPNRTTLSRKNDVMSIFKMVDLAILDFKCPIMGSLKSTCTNSYRSSIETIGLNCLVFRKLPFCILASRLRWRISAILDFRGPIMGSLKSPCTTSYRSSIDTIALNCLLSEKIAFFCISPTDRRTDGEHRCERRLNKTEKDRSANSQ